MKVRSGSLLLAGMLSALAGGAQTVIEVGPAAAYKTIAQAVDAAPATGATLRIAPGVYREKLLISKDHMTLIGTGAKSEDVVLTYDASALDAGGTKNSFSVAVTGDDFTAKNLTISNTYELTHARKEQGSQAVALMVTGDREYFSHVRLLGYQDTLFATSKTCHLPEPVDVATAPGCEASRQMFEDSYIEGHVDFIFGDSKAVFQHCELHGMAHPIVMLTAQSRLYPAEDSGYLFLDTRVTADKGVGTVIFGRPWRAYARVYFVRTSFAKDVPLDPAGWSEWAGKLKTADYADFDTTIDGKKADASKRIAPSRVLSRAEVSKLSVRSWLRGWVPDGASEGAGK